MRKFYDNTELGFALVWIGIYCVSMSLGDNLSASIGVEKLITFPIAMVLSLILLIFLKKNGLFEKNGLCKSKITAKKCCIISQYCFFLQPTFGME